jgi:hypothetical protein
MKKSGIDTASYELDTSVMEEYRKRIRELISRLRPLMMKRMQVLDAERKKLRIPRQMHMYGKQSRPIHLDIRR